MENVIKFDKVVKAFGDLTVLNNVSFIIPKGKKTFILGQSGEGKSVVIKHILGFFLPNSGSIYFEDLLLPKKRGSETKNFFLWKNIRQKIGCMFQEGALIDSLSVQENLQLTLSEQKIIKDPKEQINLIEEVTQAVRYMGRLDQKIANLSVGEKKRLGLARALACQPQVMIYDEPTTSMDPPVSETLDELVETIHESKSDLSSIVISHDIVSVKRLADYIIFLSGGSVCFQGLAKDFFSSKDPKIVQFRNGDVDGPLTNT
jgi:phospholipid/cholesterol/gamma-HCH transport system ATP-binding protein